MSQPSHPTDPPVPETIRPGGAAEMPPTVGYGATGRGGRPPLPAREFGDYELLDEIARGGMGIVYRARQRSLNRLVALKMILSGSVAGEEDVRRFRTEAEAAAALEHPNIVPIYEIGEHDGRPYFSMKLIEGGSLAQHVERLLPKPRESARILAETARAVHFAHQRGILHRDLKPANVLLDEDGSPHVTDFGLAKRTGMARGLTETGAIVGTPDYMAPEQAAGQSRSLTTSVDVYGLGAILYDLLTGHAPFEGESALAVLERVRHEEPSPPRSLRPGVDADLETICLKCLEKEPEKRFATAQALADDLQRWLDGTPIQARPVTTIERARKWVRRRPAVAALVAIVPLISLLGFGGILLEWRQAKAERAIAERERQEAKNEEARARSAWVEADRRGEELRSALYATDMQFARAAWELGDLGRMRRLLDAHRPADGRSDLRGFEWHYLQRLAEGGRREVRGYEAGGIAFSPDGNQLAMTATGGRVLLIDAATGAELRSWSVPGMGKDRLAAGLAFEPSGAELQVVMHKVRKLDMRALISGVMLGGGEPSLKSVLDGLEVAALPINGGAAVVVAGVSDARSLHAPFSKDESGFGGLIAIPGAMFMSSSGAPSPDGSRIAFGGMYIDVKGLIHSSKKAREGQPAVLVWNLATGRPQLLHEEHIGLVIAVAWSPDGCKIACAGTDAKLRMWDLGTEKVCASIEAGVRVDSLSFSRDGKTLAGGRIDGTVALWDAESGRERATFKGHAMPVDVVALAPDGMLLASAAAAEGAVHLRNTASAQGPIQVAWAAETVPQCAILAGDGLVVADSLGTVMLCDLTTGRERNRFQIPRGKLGSQPSLSRDGRSLAWRASGTELEVWDVEQGKKRCTIPDLIPGSILTTEFSPDGASIAASEVDLAQAPVRARIWDARTGKPRCTVECAEAVTRLSFSPRGDSLVGYILREQGDWEFAMWDLASGRRRAVDAGGIPAITGKLGGNAGIGPIAFSSDGARLAVSKPGSGDLVSLWDLRSGKELPPLGPYSGNITGLAFNGNDTRLAIILRSHLPGAGGVRIVDAVDGRELLALDERAEMVESLAFSPDGRRLVTVSIDQFIRWLDGSADMSAPPLGHVKIWDATPVD